MSLVNYIATSREDLRARARAYGDTAVAAARRSTLRAAERVAGAQSRVRTLAVAGQRLSNLSNRYLEQLIGQQAHTLEGVIDGGVERLKRAAKAATLRSLIDEQKTLWAQGRKQLSKDLRATWQIAKGTGRELRDLTQETYAALASKPKTKSPSARRASPRTRKAATARKRKTAA